MYCVAHAVAKVTGWDYQQVWLHVRWCREQQGKRLTDHPYGGIAAYEMRSALERAGFEPVQVFVNRRVRYAKFARTLGRTGYWILRQNGHVFAHYPGKTLSPGKGRAVIVAAYRIEKKRQA